jgi:hypothetical protein
MLSRGFKDQIYDVYRFLPPATQVHSHPGDIAHVMRAAFPPLLSSGWPVSRFALIPIFVSVGRAARLVLTSSVACVQVSHSLPNF